MNIVVFRWKTRIKEHRTEIKEQKIQIKEQKIQIKEQEMFFFCQKDMFIWFFIYLFIFCFFTGADFPSLVSHYWLSRFLKAWTFQNLESLLKCFLYPPPLKGGEPFSLIINPVN